MPRSAVLLIDLQTDFLDADHGKMSVDRQGGEAVLRVANDILAGRLLPDALPVLVLNQFPASARVANFFRRGAAIAGSPGAEPDTRLRGAGSAKVITKACPSAFSNPELERYLRDQGIQDIYVLGVFAEACVRATVLAAIQRGFTVQVLAAAVASNAAWKKYLALLAMRRAGAVVITSLPAAV